MAIAQYLQLCSRGIRYVVKAARIELSPITGPEARSGSYDTEETTPPRALTAIEQTNTSSPRSPAHVCVQCAQRMYICIKSVLMRQIRSFYHSFRRLCTGYWTEIISLTSLSVSARIEGVLLAGVVGDAEGVERALRHIRPHQVQPCFQQKKTKKKRNGQHKPSTR